MTTKTKPRLRLLERATLEDAQKKLIKAHRRGVAPLVKVYRLKYVALLEAHGWSVKAHTPVSYGAPETWIMTHP